MKSLLFLYLFLFSFFSSIAQNDFHNIEKELAMYNDFFVNADKAEHRIEAHALFEDLFKKTLKKENSFNYSFDSLKWLSKLTAPDSTFRVFTWQLFISDYKVEYNGFVQTKDGSLYNLKDNKELFSDLEYEVFSNEDWYGQLYYNLHQYIKNGKNEYLLFGYKQLNKYNKIKVAAPIYFENKKVYFGKEIFQDTLQEGGLKNRVVLQTVIEAASKLNFDNNLGIIIFDHTVLIPLKRPQEAGLSFVPDGSYHGYKWIGGKWNFIDKVFNLKLDDAPGENNKKDSRKRGLFGKLKEK